jgi:hypothetical protein
MGTGDYTIHFHQWGILQEDFYAMDKLNRFYKEISHQTNQAGLKYVTAMEAHNYPIFSMIYHPEYRLMLDPCPETIEFATILSKFLHSQAVLNLKARSDKGLLMPDDVLLPQPVDSMTCKQM